MQKVKKLLASVLALSAVTLAVGCSSKSSTEGKSSSSSSAKKMSKEKSKKKSSSKKSQKIDKKSKSAEKSSSKETDSQAEESSSQASNSAATNATGSEGSQSNQGNPASTSTATQSQTSTAATAQYVSTAGKWNANKNQRLSTFMHSWQKRMGQSYTATYDGATPDYYGSDFPDSLRDDGWKDKILLNEKAINPQWDPEATSGAEYKIVAIASNDNKWNGILYLFIIHQGNPMVLYTQTTNGGILYMRPTENVELRNNFAQIVNS